jgi:lysophospholipase
MLDSAPPLLTETADNPAPPRAVATRLTTSDGVSIRALRAPPSAGQRRGTIVLCQGRTEYVEKYFETVANLAALGFHVVTFDWRGQGGSQRLLKNPRKGHVKRFLHYERDLEAVIAWTRAECPPPYFGFGHSTGGLILFRTTRLKRDWFDRLVLASPLFGLGPIYEPVGLARTSAKIAGALGFRRAFIPSATETPVDWQPFLDNLLTSDPRRFARNAGVIEANPALGLGGPTIGWALESFKAMDEVMGSGFVERVAVPTLVVAAGKDTVVSNDAIEEVGRRLRIGRRIVVHGGLHELLNERDIFREQLIAAIDAYLRDA